MFSKNDISLLLVLLLLLVSTSSLFADDSNSSQEIAFGEVVDVHVVNVTVRVTDRNDRPVTGLTSADFVLREDGKTVEITNFREVPQIAQDEALSVDIDPSTPEIEVATTATLLFLVDNLGVDRQNRRKALNDLRKIIQELHPTTEAAIAVYDGQLRVASSLTTDTGRLLTALDTIDASAPRGLLRKKERERFFLSVLQEVGEIRAKVNQRLLGPEDAVQQLNALTGQVQAEAQSQVIEDRGRYGAMSALIDHLAAVPGRKALVYISEGLSVRPGEAALQVIYDAMLDVSYDPVRGSSSGNYEARSAALGAIDDQAPDPIRKRDQETPPPDELFAVAALAADAEVSIYPWKALGDLGGVSAEIGGAAAIGFTSFVRDTREKNLITSLRSLAEETGGGLAVNGRDLESLVEEAINEFGGYYSLGFSPEHGGDDQLHRLKVKVKKRRVNVWHPEIYVARKRGEFLQSPLLSTPGGGGAEHEAPNQL